MKVKVNDYSSTGNVMDLAQALRPRESEGGQIERLERLVERQAEIIGRMAALMVEKEWIDLDCATDFVGEYGSTIEVYVEPEPVPDIESRWPMPEIDSKWALPGPLFKADDFGIKKQNAYWGYTCNVCGFYSTHRTVADSHAALNPGHLVQYGNGK